MSSPLITIAIPTYNRVSFLGEALDSAQRQTYPNLEILVGNNASTDNTENLVRAASALDKRIRYIRHPENVGMRNNWNMLLYEAKGEYFLLLSDDDMLESGAIEKLLNLFNLKDVVMAYSRVKFIDGQSKTGGVSLLSPSNESGRNFIINSLKAFRESYPSSVLFRTEMAKKLGGFPDVGVSTDLALRLILATQGDIGFCPEPLARYRIHAACLSQDVENFRQSIMEINKWSGNPQCALYDYHKLIKSYYVSFLYGQALRVLLRGNINLLINLLGDIKETGKYTNLKVAALFCGYSFSKLFTKMRYYVLKMVSNMYS